MTGKDESMNDEKLTLREKFIVVIMVIGAAFYMEFFTDHPGSSFKTFMKNIEKNFWTIIMYASLVAMIITLIWTVI